MPTTVSQTLSREWVCASCRSDRPVKRSTCRRCGGTVWVSSGPRRGSLGPTPTRR